ncbi:MAG: threonine--tRNA ligase [Myxococcota bacterium]
MEVDSGSVMKNSSKTLTVRLPDGSTRALPAGSTALDLARQLSSSLAKEVVAACVDGRLIDLRDPLCHSHACRDAIHRVSTNTERGETPRFAQDDSKEALPLELIKAKDARARSVLRHGCEHVLATAVCALFKGAQVTMGPREHDGVFYYDFDVGRPFTPEDVQAIEQEMRRLIKRKIPFTKTWVGKKEARERFAKLGQRYKPEILDWIPDDTVSLYQSGDFIDLCRGPHVPHAGFIKAFKLLGVSACHWRGDPKRESLQRISGIAFASKKELEDHLHRLEEAKKRDHRKLGQQHELFCVSHPHVGAGLVLWLPKGAQVRQGVEELLRRAHAAAGYQPVVTPHIARSDLWKVSGHWQFYRDSMFAPMQVDEQEYMLKPMNCPFHILVYKNRGRSYRELPLRLSELGTVYRYELGGVMHGLMRARGFTQDDAHLFCRWDQIDAEIDGVLDLTVGVLKAFGFDTFTVNVSTRPQKFVGTPDQWDRAEDALKQAVERRRLPLRIDEGGGAFYGPKIDLHLTDCLGRQWQCSTVQLDFNNPERFDLGYVDETGASVRPVMIHRALLGSIERFIGILIEQYAAAFPMWLAPQQVRVLTVADRHADYAKQVAEELRRRGIRVDAPASSDTLGAKIRQARLDKIPVLAVLGDRETEQQTVSMRSAGEDKSRSLSLVEFADFCVEQAKYPLVP